MSIVKLLIPAALIALPAALIAQVQPNATGSDVLVKGRNSDPNRQVCRTSDATGSRLRRKRECRTASEWAEQQAIDRQTVERSQAMRWKGNE